MEYSTVYKFSNRGFCSSADFTYRCNNFGNYQNVKVDSLLEQYEEEIIDYEKRESLLLQIQDILFDELPVLALHYPISTLPMKKDVAGIDEKMWRLAYTAWHHAKKNDWKLPQISNENDRPPGISMPLVIGIVAVIGVSTFLLRRRN